LRMHRETVAKAMGELDRRLDVVRARQHLDRWNLAVARVKDALL
jgi:hypothetical protein